MGASYCSVGFVGDPYNEWMYDEEKVGGCFLFCPPFDVPAAASSLDVRPLKARLVLVSTSLHTPTS